MSDKAQSDKNAVPSGQAGAGTAEAKNGKLKGLFLWIGPDLEPNSLFLVANPEKYDNAKVYCLQNLHMTSPPLTRLRQLWSDKYRFVFSFIYWVTFVG